MIVSGFTHLVSGMAAFFAGNATGLTFDYGFRARGKKFNQGTVGSNRVVLIPGDVSGSSGALAPPRRSGRWLSSDGTSEIRPLVDWDRVFTLSCWGYDPTDGVSPAPGALPPVRDERLQIDAAEQALEWAVRAVTFAVGADVVWGPVRWTPPNDASFGLELLTVFTLQQPLFDQPIDRGMPGFTLAKDPSS